MLDVKDAGLLRHIPTVEERNGTVIRIGSRRLLNFASNDYLGLSHHPALKEAVLRAVEEAPTSSSASRLICGDHPLLRQLEETVAALKERRAAILFPSGYHANIGVICALCGRGDFILSDGDNHASIVDACRLSHAETVIFKHNDPESLASELKRIPESSFRLVVTETVFSTDGSVAPLPEIVALCERYGAALMVDEAHATGTLGRQGRGGEEEFDLKGRCNIIMGTFGKALASIGGFIAASEELIHLLINRSRTLIYSTALPPLTAAVATTAIRLLLSNPQLLQRLRSNINIFTTTMKEYGHRIERKHLTPIVPIHIGCERRVMEVRGYLIERGFYTAALRYPTVPKGKAMIRVSISAAHREDSIVSLAENITSLLNDLR